MNDTQDVKSQEESSPVVDLAGLYKYSGMVDAMRDTAKYLSRPGTSVSSRTIGDMTSQYTKLRTQLGEVLSEDGKTDLLTWTYDIDGASGDVTIDGVYAACVNLSRWMDLVHTTPSFLLGQQMQQVALHQQSAQVAAQTASLPKKAPNLDAHSVPDMSANSGTGQYL